MEELTSGQKAARTIRERHGADFYQNLGKKGGKAKVRKGFGVNRELARSAGRRGGRVGKRPKEDE